MTHWRSPRTPYEWDFFWGMVFTSVPLLAAVALAFWVILT